MRAASGPSGGGLLSGRFSGGSNSRSIRLSSRSDGTSSPQHCHPRVGTDGRAQLRGPAGAGRDAARPHRRAPPLARRARVRGRQRGGPADPRAGRNAARDLLRDAGGGHGRRDPRRPRLHPARAGADPGDLGARARGLAARVDPRDRRGRRGGGGGGGRAGRHRPHALQPSAPARDRLRDRRRRRHGLRGGRPGARAARLRVRRARVAAPARRRDPRLAGRADPRGHGRRGAPRPGVDGAQGRRPLLRRRLRDHPADAGGRRRTRTAG